MLKKDVFLLIEVITEELVRQKVEVQQHQQCSLAMNGEFHVYFYENCGVLGRLESVKRKESSRRKEERGECSYF